MSFGNISTIQGIFFTLRNGGSSIPSGVREDLEVLEKTIIETITKLSDRNQELEDLITVKNRENAKLTSLYESVDYRFERCMRIAGEQESELISFTKAVKAMEPGIKEKIDELEKEKETLEEKLLLCLDETECKKLKDEIHDLEDTISGWKTVMFRERNNPKSK